MQRSRLFVQGWPWLLSVATASFLLNYIWEIVQMPAFTSAAGQAFPPGIAFAARHCFIATLGDALTASGTFAVGWALHRRVDWICDLTRRDVLVISLALGTVAIVVEVVNVYLFRRWGYSSLMPVVPVLGVGLLPLVQLALLTLATFRLVCIAASRSGFQRP